MVEKGAMENFQSHGISIYRSWEFFFVRDDGKAAKEIFQPNGIVLNSNGVVCHVCVALESFSLY